VLAIGRGPTTSLSGEEICVRPPSPDVPPVGHGRLGHRGRAKAKAGAAGVVPIPIPRQAPSSSPHDDDDGVEELRQCRTWPHPSPRRPSLLAPQAQARGADTGQSSRPRHPCSPCGASTWRGAAETAAGGGARRWGGGLVSRCWRRVGLTEQRNRAEKCFCHSSVGGVAIPWKCKALCTQGRG
jgi:hypothetical protein